jgi:hypothetical protein
MVAALKATPDNAALRRALHKRLVDESRTVRWVDQGGPKDVKAYLSFIVAGSGAYGIKRANTLLGFPRTTELLKEIKQAAYVAARGKLQGLGLTLELVDDTFKEARWVVQGHQTTDPGTLAGKLEAIMDQVDLGTRRLWKKAVAATLRELTEDNEAVRQRRGGLVELQQQLARGAVRLPVFLGVAPPPPATDTLAAPLQSVGLAYCQAARAARLAQRSERRVGSYATDEFLDGLYEIREAMHQLFSKEATLSVDGVAYRVVAKQGGQLLPNLELFDLWRAGRLEALAGSEQSGTAAAVSKMLEGLNILDSNAPLSFPQMEAVESLLRGKALSPEQYEHLEMAALRLAPSELPRVDAATVIIGDVRKLGAANAKSLALTVQNILREYESSPTAGRTFLAQTIVRAPRTTVARLRLRGEPVPSTPARPPTPEGASAVVSFEKMAYRQIIDAFGGVPRVPIESTIRAVRKWLPNATIRVNGDDLTIVVPHTEATGPQEVRRMLSSHGRALMDRGNLRAIVLELRPDDSNADGQPRSTAEVIEALDSAIVDATAGIKRLEADAVSALRAATELRRGTTEDVTGELQRNVFGWARLARVRYSLLRNSWFWLEDTGEVKVYVPYGQIRLGTANAARNIEPSRRSTPIKPAIFRRSSSREKPLSGRVLLATGYIRSERLEKALKEFKRSAPRRP